MSEPHLNAQPQSVDEKISRLAVAVSNQEGVMMALQVALYGAFSALQEPAIAQNVRAHLARASEYARAEENPITVAGYERMAGYLLAALNGEATLPPPLNMQ